MLVLKVTKINITFRMNDKKNNMGLQQGSAGCKIRVHRIFRVGPHGVGRLNRYLFDGVCPLRNLTFAGILNFIRV